MKHIYSFCGRKKELNEIRESLKKGNHVLISGSYGMGKTRLALESVRDFSPVVQRLSLNDPPATLKRKLFRRERLYPTRDVRRFVILDDIVRMSHQKSEFLRFLADRGYVFIAIEENGIPVKEHERLRYSSVPHIQLPLSYLSKNDTYEFLETLNERLVLGKEKEQLVSLAKILKGHPLSLIQTIKEL